MNKQWLFLEEAAPHFAGAKSFQLPRGTSTIISDRIIAAVSSDTRVMLEDAQDALETFYLELLPVVPQAAAEAARGEAQHNTAEAAAFSLGQIGLAHAIVARAASRRVDDRFERLLRSRALERYVRLLLVEELSGHEIAQRLKKDPAEVSRRLKLLREIGAVECRRDGNRIVNFLTSAAVKIARACNMGGMKAEGAQLEPAVVVALEDQKKLLPAEMRKPLIFESAARRHAP